MILMLCLTLVFLVWTGFLERRANSQTALLAGLLESPASSNSGARLLESLARLHASAFRYQLTGSGGDEDEFRAEMREFSRLIVEAKASLKENSELQDRLEAAFQPFIDKAGQIEPVKGIRRDTPPAVAEELDKILESLRAIATELQSVEERIHTFRQRQGVDAVIKLQSTIRWSIVALGALLVSVALLVYQVASATATARPGLTEDARERQEKLASLGVLATGVAHEIRNPLTAIKFRLFSLKKAYGGGLSENEDYRTIGSEIDRLETIVKNFLEFARPPEPKFAMVSSNGLLHDLQRLLEPEMSSRNIRLLVDAGEAVSFKADKQQLSQVLINLAQNAADSMPGGGTVTLQARQGAAVLSRKPEPVVLLEVIDTGPGIPREIQHRLFDPFFSTKDGGTGLGLAIAARIVERHGGLMQFSSRKDRGATFSVVLPISKEHVANSNIAD